MRTDPVRYSSYSIKRESSKGIKVIHFSTYDAVKRMTEERRARSMARYELLYRGREDGSVSSPGPTEAEVIELRFDTACESESIGA